MKQTVTVIGIIYKSVKYLNFMVDQFNRYCKSSNYDVKTLILANDANESVLKALQKGTTPFVEYHDKDPNAYYLNRTYRAINFVGMSTKSDIIIFVNSDMAYTEGWIDSLLKFLSPNTIPCSRLVESGKLSSGQYAVSKNFGQLIENYDEKGFLAYAESIKEHKAVFGGLFMPCAFYTKDFIASGGYPEGNICVGGVGAADTPCLRSGDDFFFGETLKGKLHLTVFDSIVYHIQEGELDEPEDKIKYSFLMPYYNRDYHLICTLRSFLVRYSMRKDFEIVIIEDYKNIHNNAYHDRLLEVIKGFNNLNIRHLQYSEKETFSPPVLYNYGAKESLGEILVITNPECYHEVDLLKGFDRELSANKNVYVICGCQSVDLQYNSYVTQDGVTHSEPTGIYLFRMWYQHSVLNNRRLHFCSAITKDNYFKIGGFDEKYSEGLAYDDDDFRDTILYKRDIKVILRDDLLVSHLNHDVQYQEKNRRLYNVNLAYYKKKWNKQ